MIKNHKKQNSIFNSIAIILCLLLLFLIPLRKNFTWAQENNEVVNDVQNDQNFINYQKTNSFLNALKSEISLNEDVLLSVNRQISETEDSLNDAKDKINSLEGQILNLDNQISDTLQIINNVSLQIDQKQSEIDELNYLIKQQGLAISDQKNMFLDYLKVIYFDRVDIGENLMDDSSLESLKLLFDEQNTADKLKGLRYNEVLEKQGREIYEKISTLIDEQKLNQKKLEIKKQTLIVLFKNLADQKAELELIKEAKNKLLEETKGQESIYQQLLNQSLRNQEEILQQINTLRDNLVYVQDRMNKLGDKFNPNDYANLLNVDSDSSLLNYLIGNGNSEFTPIWPVSPDRGVSAYFKESSYYDVFHMQHNAVDIRAFQSTPVKSAADGIVYKAKNNGYGYSYILIAHANGFMTLYGHISEILVKEGQNVNAGEIIGLSGGMPGSKGAGPYTTGPHLHFEVLKNGQNVDPLNYLNLAYLKLESLPDKYLNKAMGDRTKIRRMPVKVKNPNNLTSDIITDLTVDLDT